LRLHAVALVSALVLTTPAWCDAADPSPSAADERARFKTAKDLHDKGDSAGALPLFRAIAGPNARLYAARCLIELKQLPEAYEELSATIREASARAGTEARYATTRDAASTERTALAARIGLVVIAVTERPAGLEVKIAGRPVPADRLGEAVPVAPGPVLVEASAPNRLPFERRLAVGAGASEMLAISLPPISAGAPLAASPIATPVATKPQGGGLRTAGIVVAGVGVAGMATFAVTGLLAGSKYDEVYKACGGARCVDPKYSDQISTGKTFDTVANIGLAAGIAGIAGGTLMILLGGPRQVPVSVSASPTDARVFFSGHF
jgi:hypothetical protein